MKQNKPTINIIVPLYNEAAVFDHLIERLDKVCQSTMQEVEVILIDDGSQDRTPHLMQSLSKSNERYTSIFLSRNFGHQYALSAGLRYVNASEAVFIIDGDLQDPPELMDDFFKQIKNGYDVVYAVRQGRKESWLKKKLYKSFYALLKRIAYIELPLDAGDFSMISRRVADEINEMPEESRFLRGMRSWVGFNQIGIPYERHQRAEGESKYSFRQLFKLAFNGIFNFSEFPIKLITQMGMMTCLLAAVYLAVTLVKKYFFGTVPEGFTAVVSWVILFGGMQLVAIGLIGEYVLRIFFQVKKRPLFIIKEIIREGSEKSL